MKADHPACAPGVSARWSSRWEAKSRNLVLEPVASEVRIAETPQWPGVEGRPGPGGTYRFALEGWSVLEGPTASLEPLGTLLLDTLHSVHSQRQVLNGLFPNVWISPDGAQVFAPFNDHQTPVGRFDPGNGRYPEAVWPYLAPEQTGKLEVPLGVEADLYNWGCLIVYLATGRPPFAHAPWDRSCRQTLTQAPDLAWAEEAHWPPALREMLSIVLAKNPEDRYRSVEGLDADWGLLWRKAARGTRETFDLRKRDFSESFRPAARLWGRDRELDELSRVLDRVRFRQGPAVGLVVGAEGLGKSLLLKTLHEDLSLPEEGWFSWEGRRDRQTPYGTLKRFLQEFLVHPAWDDAEFQQHYVHQVLQELGSSAGVLCRLVPEWERFGGRETRGSDAVAVELKSQLDFCWATVLRVWLRTRPLMLLIDDAQSLGRETLSVLELVLASPEAATMACFLATPQAQGPWSEWSALLAEGALVSVTLAPLDADSTEHIVRSLPAAAGQVADLAELLYRKTQGIPRSLEFFWRNAVELDAVRPDRVQRSWKFEFDKLQNAVLPGSSLKWMQSRVDHWEGEGRTLLTLLSLFCEGLPADEVGGAWLTLFGESPQDPGAAALELQREGWITTSPVWRIGDPRLGEAVIARLEDSRRSALYSRLASYRRRQTPTSLEAFLTLARAVEELESADRMQHLDQLSAAARLLVQQGAFARAHAVLALVPQESLLARLPDTEPEVLLLLQLLAFEGRRDDFVAFGEQVAARWPEGLPLRFGHAVMRGWLDLGEMTKALQAGLAALLTQNIRLPSQPGIPQVIVASIPLSRALSKLKLEELLALSPSKGRDAELVLDLLQNLSPAAFFARPLLLPIVTAQHILFGLKAGLSSGLSISFATYAFQQCVIFRNPTSARQYMLWAGEILRLLPSGQASARVEFLAWAFVRWWHQPLRRVSAALVDNARQSLSLGEINNGTSSFIIGLFYAVWAGEPLEAVGRLLGERYKAVQIRGDNQNLAFFKAAVSFLEAEQKGQERQAAAREELSALVQSQKALGAWNTYFGIAGLQLLAETLDGAEPPGPEIADELLRRLPMVGLATFGNVAILVLGALARLDPRDKARDFRMPNRALELLRGYQKKGGEVVAPLIDLIEGARFRCQRRFAEALTSLSRALDRFLEVQWTVFAGLAAELRARVFDDQGMAELARKDWKSAYWQWLDIGYGRHAALLSQKMPWLSQSIQGAGAGSSARLETLESLVRSSLELTRQPSRSRLASKVVELYGDGGHERILFVTREGKQWRRWGHDEGPLGRQEAPLLLLQRCWDKREPLVYNALGVDAEDAYFEGYRGSCAVLPLVRGDQTLALVYLENPLLAGAFPSARMESLVQLASHAAASFQNHTLLEEMEQQVSLRNQDLLQEKERSETLLLNILPKTSAEELKNTGRTLARAYPDVTVLFLDFVNFTTKAGEMGAQELVDVIDEYFSGFDAIMGRHGLEKIKTMGDAYMAVGGLPEGGASRCRDVVLAALDMLTFVAEVDSRRRLRGQTGFQARVGLHTGPVVAGVVGTRKFQFDLWGDTVNVAARMEQNSEAGRINVSRATWQLVKDEFPHTFRGKIAAKNKGEIEMYFLG